MEQQKLKISTENLRSVIYESFILELFILVSALRSYCGDKKQSPDFFQITCFKERKDMMVEENLKIFQLSDKIKSIYGTITCTLEKNFFAIVNFEGL